MIDIDHFKTINDNYGHKEGDKVLQSVAKSIKGGMRESDPVFRWGGEEFLVLLPGANLNQARARLEALCKSWDSKVQQEITGNHRTVTLSIGLTIHKRGETNATALNRADQALYKAKTNGRNQIFVMG